MVHGTSLMQLVGTTVVPELFAGNLVSEISIGTVFELKRKLFSLQELNPPNLHILAS